MGKGPVPGERLGPYTLDQVHGSGGIATVYRASGPDGERVAVKVLHPAGLDTDEERRFEREYRALSRLKHPNIVEVFDAGVQDGFPWIAMEFVDGDDLDTAVEGWAGLAGQERWERVEALLRGLCAALEHVHGHGLVHRDLKPANVLIGADGAPRLSDFGVVKDHHANTTKLTKVGNLVGTVAFMAPEQITDEPVDSRTDLYSLGAVLYVMLTDRRPIEANSVTGFLARHLSHIPPAPSQIRPDVPRRLEAICQRLLYKDRSQRFASARAVLAALDDDDDPDRLPLRGRDDLLAIWRERLQRLSQAGGGAILVQGGRHLGRTRLLEGFADQAAATGIQVALTSGETRNPVTPLLRRLDADSADRLPAPKHLRALAAACRGTPTLLVVDDLDAARPKMRQALARLIERVAHEEGEPLLFLGAVGPGASPLPDLDPTLLPLPPLDRRETLQLLRDRGLRGQTLRTLTPRFRDELGGRPAALHAQILALVEAGWLRRNGARLESARSTDVLVNHPLPVPAGARSDLERDLARLEPDALAVAEVLAIADAPLPMQDLLALAHADRIAVERAAEGGLATVDDGAVCLVRPWATTVILDRLSRARRRDLHLAAARRLSRTHRRTGAARIAHHLEAAGHPSEAYPRYLQAARQAFRRGQTADVLRLCRHARTTRIAGESRLPPEKARAYRRRLYQMEGETQLTRGDWKAALQPLRDAVQAAREAHDTQATGQCLAALGRAWYRVGAFDEAMAALEEALQKMPKDSIERTRVVRSLADLRLREGRYEAAEALWDEALATARESGGADAEARARRGRAHLLVLRGDLLEAADELERAHDLLRGTRAHPVRAAILARAVELDLAAGRIASAHHRAETLVELVTTHSLDLRAAEAWSLLAEARALAVTDDVEEAIDRAARLCSVAPAETLGPGLRTARVMLRRGETARVARLLPDREAYLQTDGVSDLSGALAALRARVEAAEAPGRAIDLARWCLVREPARLLLRQVERIEDAGHALIIGGEIREARSAAKQGLRLLAGAGQDGLRLRLLLLFYAADSEARVADATRQVLHRILAEQPPAVRARVQTHPELSRVQSRSD